MVTLGDIRTALSKHRAELSRRFMVKSIGVFGSYVRGEQDESSDVDFLVEFEEPVSLLRIVGLENFLGDVLGVKADVVPKKDLRAELRDRVLEEAVYV
ncbi:MAG: nucleotidyltransferase family protein [Candidatus Altiarchaeota archaeon]|nr:nucleotidyltransferase family protein [Candidatus Altiarchaeota archaeon]